MVIPGLSLVSENLITNDLMVSKFRQKDK